MPVQQPGTSCGNGRRLGSIGRSACTEQPHGQLLPLAPAGFSWRPLAAAPHCRHRAAAARTPAPSAAPSPTRIPPPPWSLPSPRSARANHDAAAYFITRVSSSDEVAALKPLLHEGPVKGCPVEHASAHVAGAQSAKVLSYEPLKGSDDGEH